MNRKPPRLKATRPPPKPMTLGDVFGADIKRVQDQRARRAQLNDMGFVPLKSDA